MDAIEALAEAIEFAEQDGMALTPAGAAMVSRWKSASSAGWRPTDSAPEHEHVILATSGGHVGEAIMLVDEDTGAQKWAWAIGPVHADHKPLGWKPMPKFVGEN